MHLERTYENKNNLHLEFKELINTVHIGILIANENGYVQFVNHTAEELFGMSSQIITGKHIATLLSHSGILDVLEFEEEALNLVSIQNKQVFIHVKPIYGDNQQLIGAIAVLQNMNNIYSLDIVPPILNTELSSLIDGLSDGLIICDAQGKIININTIYATLFEINRKEVIGGFIHDFLHQYQVSDMVELFVIEKKKPITKEIEICRFNKKIKVSSYPIFRQDGQLWYVVSCAREINLSQTKHIAAYKNDDSSNAEELLEKGLFTEEVIAKSQAMCNVVNMAKHVAGVDTNVLLLGETGVGKEVVTEVIHKLSSRSKGPLVKINCGAIPETLLESELFGYEKGSFTGASTKGKIGLFELANGGTIFLDEIGDIPLNLQVKLLRAIQQKEITRVGGAKAIKLDIRFIAATHKNLEKMVEEGTFREDLYYRINVVPIRIPPLHERREDIVALALHFLNKFNTEYGYNKKINQSVMDYLVQYSWPGNIRQLENVIERMVVMSETEVIGLEHVPNKIIQQLDQYSLNSIPQRGQSLKAIVAEYEKKVLIEMLKIHKTIRKAALELKLDHSTIVRKLKRYKINYEEIVKK